MNGFFVRITPTGLPVQWVTPSFQVQVSGSQLTAVKSSSPSARQPGPVAVDGSPGKRGGLVGIADDRNQHQTRGKTEDTGQPR